MTDTEILLQTPRFRVVRQSYRTPDGARHVRDTVQHPGAVAIVPMVDDDHVCLIRNYRRAAEEALIELPAGTLEPDEAPLQTAQRELEEETGYRARSMRLLHAFYTSPGILDERMHLYVATGLEPGKTCLDAGEQIENLVVGWDEALAMLQQGRIRDAKTLVGLLYWDRARRLA
jgi:ADP-ribose pyrophosphatase